MRLFPFGFAPALAAALMAAATVALPAQQLDGTAAVRGVDSAFQNRFQRVAGYTATERYAVYRNNDEVHPVAEMTVRADYKRDTGKSYTVLSQSGSEIVRRLVLGTLLDNERRINEPGIREGAWIVSANYEMKLKSEGTERLEGRECVALSLNPKRVEPHLVVGTLWVDAKDFSIVQIEGMASKAPSLLTGPTQMLRQYAKVEGFAEPTHARAISNSFLFGRTVVKIDYSDYRLQLEPGQ
jgi:outer membrane lipoprotein-sorting protein